jgi:hypothetical protein
MYVCMFIYKVPKNLAPGAPNSEFEHKLSDVSVEQLYSPAASCSTARPSKLLRERSRLERELAPAFFNALPSCRSPCEAILLSERSSVLPRSF